MERREFLKTTGLAASGLMLTPAFVDKLLAALSAGNQIKVYKVLNGDCFQNTEKLWDMLGIANYISATDVVVIKGNAQWQNQGYTHTGVIKGVIDKILEIPGFNGEVVIADNVQAYGSEGKYAFDVASDRRKNNWPDHNWTTLAAEYQSNGKPVSVKRWYSSTGTISGPQDGEGNIRDFFTFDGRKTYLSYPIFESPLNSGRMIDIKNGVWESGSYTGRKVKTIVIPTLNNHGNGEEDYSGITSAIKSFYGVTEIHDGMGAQFQGHYNIHGSSFSRGRADYAGELVARYINNMFRPNLYITAAMFSGYVSRTLSTGAAETKTVLACDDPATLDYIACRDVISPYASFLNPDLENNTRKQIEGCVRSGIGTMTPAEIEVITYDFLNPKVNRLDVDRKLRDFKDGKVSETELKNTINEYMEN